MSKAVFQHDELINEMLTREHWDISNIAYCLLGVHLVKNRIFWMDTGEEIPMEDPHRGMEINPSWEEVVLRAQFINEKFKSKVHQCLKISDTHYPSSYCIQWALDNGIEPPWLNTAIEKGYIPPETHNIEPNPSPNFVRNWGVNAEANPSNEFYLELKSYLDKLSKKGAPKPTPAALRAELKKNPHLIPLLIEVDRYKGIHYFADSSRIEKKIIQPRAWESLIYRYISKLADS